MVFISYLVTVLLVIQSLWFFFFLFYQELQEKQAVRQTVMLQAGNAVVDTKRADITSPEQAMWDKTKLRQRKISMQIKV